MGMLAVAFLTLLIPIQGVECTPVDENSKKQFQLGIQVHPQATHGERDDVVTKLENIVEANKERWGVKAYYAELEPDSDGWHPEDEGCGCSAALPRILPGRIL